MTTLALAIIAAAIAVVALVVTLRREWLDRPRLEISADPVVADDGSAELVVTLDNEGRRPLTVRQVGLDWDIMDDAVAGGPQGEVVFREPGSRVRIESDGSYQLRWAVPALPIAHVDTAVRFYAGYSRGGMTRTRPMLLFRDLLALGWQPNQRHHEFFDPRPQASVARALEPRWRLWRPRHLRTDTTAFAASGPDNQVGAQRRAGRRRPDLSAVVRQLRRGGK
jgi:hypothetical protein